MVSRVAVADNRGGRPAGGVGRHGLRLDSIAKFGWADPVRRAAEAPIQASLVKILGALHKVRACPGTSVASPCRRRAPAGAGLLQNVTVEALAEIWWQRSGALFKHRCRMRLQPLRTDPMLSPKLSPMLPLRAAAAGMVTLPHGSAGRAFPARGRRPSGSRPAAVPTGAPGSR
jgi:hypothetical protein